MGMCKTRVMRGRGRRTLCHTEQSHLIRHCKHVTSHGMASIHLHSLYSPATSHQHCICMCSDLSWLWLEKRRRRCQICHWIHAVDASG